ncbi:Imm21 family immunity protein [Actinacidiphila rubida]|nr:Imm21 family immunity protein [Actinacidiphila rubida]
MSEQTILADRSDADLTWVRSMGGPLVVVPVSALERWGGCTMDSLILDGSRRDDYARACEVEEYAGVIPVGEASALVLGQEPATTCYVPEHRVFVRWLAADSEAELFEAVEAVLAGPDTAWEDGGTWTTDGDAVLMDSAEAGADLGVEYPTGGGFPDQAPVPIPAGTWRVRAVHTGGESPWVGVVQLLPAS